MNNLWNPAIQPIRMDISESCATQTKRINMVWCLVYLAASWSIILANLRQASAT